MKRAAAAQRWPADDFMREASNRHKENALVYPRSSAFSRGFGREQRWGRQNREHGVRACWRARCSRTQVATLHAQPNRGRVNHGVTLRPTDGGAVLHVAVERTATLRSGRRPSRGKMGLDAGVSIGCAHWARDRPGSGPDGAARFRQLVSGAAGVLTLLFPGQQTTACPCGPATWYDVARPR